MYGKAKVILIYVSLVLLGVLLAVNLAQAKSVEPVFDNDNDSDIEALQSFELNQAELDQLLAPIALYPDSVLSQVLVAATYPLELVQAARWRENNSELDEKEALDAVEDMDWDPSVKALVPFDKLLQQLVQDLNWLQDLGDAFLSNESQVLASVQALRHKAYQQGSLSNNKYIEVVEEDDDILITPVNREVIYVPYYDTRVVYGNWHWANYPPYYWHRPSHYYWHAGLYWSPRVYIRNSFFFGGFHWRNRQVVVHHSPRHYGRYDDGQKRVRVNEYQRWTHNSHHRRGVRYSNNTPKTVYSRQDHSDVKRIRNNEGQSKVKRTRNSATLQQQVKRETLSDNRYKGDRSNRSQANPKVNSTHQRLRQETTQTQRNLTTHSQENRQRPEGETVNEYRYKGERSNRSQGNPKVHSTQQRLRQETTQTQNQQRVRQQSVQQPVKQYQTDSRQADSRAAAPKQKSYNQAKQRNYSQPKQRTYSQPQQRVRNTVQRPSKSAHRSSSKVRSHGAKQQQR